MITKQPSEKGEAPRHFDSREHGNEPFFYRRKILVVFWGNNIFRLILRVQISFVSFWQENIRNFVAKGFLGPVLALYLYQRKKAQMKFWLLRYCNASTIRNKSPARELGPKFCLQMFNPKVMLVPLSRSQTHCFRHGPGLLKISEGQGQKDW